MIRIRLNLVYNNMLDWGLLTIDDSIFPGTCRKMLRYLSAAVVASLTLAGCAYHGGSQSNVDNPPYRKVAWFSYLDGYDIRQSCVPGAPDRFRLVYNGQYEKQVRSYEITGGGSGGYYIARAMGTPNLLDLQLDDLLAPWRWQKSEMPLNPAEMDEFRDRLAASGWGQGAPQGKRLHSRDFYWISAGCRDGQFHYDAWVHAQGDFPEVKFQDFLLARDKTGMAFRQPVKVGPLDRAGQGQPRDRPGTIFSLSVSGEGIGGLINAF